MRLKPGTSLKGVRPELVLGLLIAETIWQREGIELVVTAVTDGEHASGSLHYVGLACDLRSNNLPPDRIQPVAKALREALGEEFDIVVESNHFHIEYQPKK